jgi:hypothetical protein
MPDHDARLRPTAALLARSRWRRMARRHWAGRRYHLRQVYGTWRGPRYDLSFEFTPLDGAKAAAHNPETGYLAIHPVEQVAGLMRTVGFENVRRVDGGSFNQCSSALSRHDLPAR